MKSSAHPSPRHGFTLIEILIVIASIAILVTVVIVTISPARTLAKARNGQRYADISTILGAIYEYQLDHDQLPQAIGVGEYEICKTGVECPDGYIDLHVLTDGQQYLTAIPEDPNAATEISTGYSVAKQKFNSRITIIAHNAELDEAISISR